ncbi:MAG: ferritin family protein [Gammaproteobacteria bacterium]|nr:ferritin family protein [Gammaproteobacteria bacterium]
MLSTRIETTGELMSIALQAEREAIRRYAQLSSDMREAGNESVAALFERMVIEEQEHERLLLKWMARESIPENTEIGPISWSDPQVSTTYDDDACNPHHSTPYKALAFAVHNEEIAFRFYTHVAADSDNEEVRKYAEILAREELGHAALLRVERRLAFHAQRDNGLSEPVLDPGAVHNEADLLAAALHIDRYLIEAITRIAAEFPQIGSLARETQQQVRNNENALSDLALGNSKLPGSDISNNLALLEQLDAKNREKPAAPEAKLQQLGIYCDRSFAFYDAIMVKAADEPTMLTAQRLTSSALDRIGVLKQISESVVDIDEVRQ